jgi:hypothetical protein
MAYMKPEFVLLGSVASVVLGNEPSGVDLDDITEGDPQQFKPSDIASGLDD